MIHPREVAPGWVALYAATFAAEVPCALIRGFVALILTWLATTILRWHPVTPNDVAVVVAYGPLAVSLLTLVLPLGGWWWEQRIGARPPSERERLVYEDALAQLTAANPRLRPPHRWCVQDTLTPNAAAYADTLMVTRGLLDSPHLTPALAHELGHLNSSDARLSAPSSA